MKDGDDYVINGSKMFVTNGIQGNTFALLTKTDPNAEPSYRGISLFIIEKGGEGFTVGKKIKKLGYRGIDTTEFAFDDFRVPITNLLGGVEGQGFKHIMSGLEGGRVNIAARAVGVAQAAFDAAITYAQQRVTFGKPIAEHPGHPAKTRRYGYQDRSSSPAHPVRRSQEGPGRKVGP